MEWSLRELAKLNIIEQYSNGFITRTQAAESLGLSLRQISRLKRCLLQEGSAGIKHKGVGRNPPNRISKTTENQILEVFLDWKRNSDDGVNASHLRDILLRDRRAQMGDILYLDGSPHRWLGENEPKITLILASDDSNFY